jgi:hypothetical protein
MGGRELESLPAGRQARGGEKKILSTKSEIRNKFKYQNPNDQNK